MREIETQMRSGTFPFLLNMLIERRKKRVSRMNRAGVLVKADYAYQRQITGQGIGIAVMDTGDRVIVMEHFINFGQG